MDAHAHVYMRKCNSITFYYFGSAYEIIHKTGGNDVFSFLFIIDE